MSSALFAIGARALAANYAALQTTGHNIANANVPGYSRQRVELQTSQGQFTGAGFFGRGVDVATVSRAHDAFVTREAATAKAFAAADTARLNQMQQLEQVFKSGEQGLGHATSQFLNSMSDLASRPYDSATRQVVLSRAEELSQRFVEAGTQIGNVQRGVNEALQASVDSVNALARSIAEVNGRIAGSRGLGQPPNDLLDQRDELISRLSEHVQVTTIAAEDGTMSVFMGGGQRLVLGVEAEQLQLVDDIFDPARSAIGIAEGTGLRRLSTEAINSGAIAGLLRFQDSDLVAARNMVGQMAAALADAVNAQQNLGLDLDLELGSDMFAVGAPVAMPANTNLQSGGSYVGSVTLTVVDARQLQASEYRLRADPLGSGQWQLTRLSDGLTRLVNSGDVVDGVQIDVVNADTNDQFLLQPVGRAADEMRSLLTHPRDIAAASPLVATTAIANTGTATLGALTMASAPLDPQGTANITFTTDTGDYVWDLLDINGNVIASGGGTWVPGQVIPSPPDPDINGFQLALSGAPRTNDVLTVSPTQQPTTNNGNAIALAGLRDRMLVGLRTVGGSLEGGSTLNEAYIAALANVGVRTQSVQSSASMSGALAAQAETARASQSGVNLDEEAARLIQFQQSYQAAAKVLQTAQSVFDVLLDAAG